MTPEQQAELRQAAHSRPDCAEALATRDCIALAAILSVGRVRYRHTQIGPGTVVAVMRPLGCGGKFLDAVVKLGEQDRDIYWGMDPVRRGEFDLSIPEARDALLSVKSQSPEFGEAIDLLMQFGQEPDPLTALLVGDALFHRNGSDK